MNQWRSLRRWLTIGNTVIIERGELLTPVNITATHVEFLEVPGSFPRKDFLPCFPTAKTKTTGEQN